MGVNQSIQGILSSDPDIKVTGEENGIVYFTLYDKEYGLIGFGEDVRSLNPIVFVLNDTDYEHPHIMTDEVVIGEDKYRSICLYEQGSIINYIRTYEEKIYETIVRLKALVSLSYIEVEREFQREFLYYWKDTSQLSLQAYIKPEITYQKLNLYQNSKEELRAVSRGISVNDKREYKHIPNIEVYYIPITDNRRILPPVKNKPWNVKDILKIIRGRDISRISKETYEQIELEKTRASKIILIFEMRVDEQKFNFGVLVELKINSDVALMEKLKNSIIKITPIMIERCDYYFLNQQIGNDISIISKKVAIVGCGSLGSYVATELVKNGIKEITVYDDDIIEPVNILRHSAEMWWCGSPKAFTMKYKLESIHPEIRVNHVKQKLTSDILKKDMHNYDLIIFTVGNSDVQLESNRVFVEECFNKPVIFSWLEAGGENSHILTIDYTKEGCFECLFTNHEGNLINNKANILGDDQIESYTMKNGCGATRVAYGTGILLRTTSVLLNAVRQVLEETIHENTLLDITTTVVTYNGDTFKERECHCCGNRNSK